MRTLVLGTLLIVVSGLAVWSFFFESQQSRELIVLLTEDQRTGPCGAERVRESLKAIGALTQRWDDEEIIARTTPRIALAGPVSKLRSTQRELEGLEVAPCLVVARHYRIEAMKASLDMFRAFMADLDFGVFAAQIEAEKAGEESERRTLAIRERLYPEEVRKEKTAAAEAERQRLVREAEAKRIALEQDAEERRREEEVRRENEREAHARLQRIREESAAEYADSARQIEQMKQVRAAKMKRWGTEYSQEMGAAKAALREVISANEEKNAPALAQACSRLQAAMAQLNRSPIRQVPDWSAHLQFKVVLSRLNGVGEKCVGGDSGAVSYAVAKLQEALQGFTAALKPYGLTP